MKIKIVFAAIFLTMQSIQGQPRSTFITTKLGTIAVHIKEVPGTIPIVFLHGVYLDHHLWDQQILAFPNRTTIAIDMPMHGESRGETPGIWTIHDGGDMLLTILDSLGYTQVFGVGHSWGSMTLVSAASKRPSQFYGLALCNMPFEAATKQRKRQFAFQHLMLPFRGFYHKQVAKALFANKSLKENPALEDELARSMSLLSNRQVRQTDRAVIVNNPSLEKEIKSLEVPAFALKGKEDYVPSPPSLPLTIVEGGHISPLEQPEEVIECIKSMIARTSRMEGNPH